MPSSALLQRTIGPEDKKKLFEKFSRINRANTHTISDSALDYTSCRNTQEPWKQHSSRDQGGIWMEILF